MELSVDKCTLFFKTIPQVKHPAINYSSMLFCETDSLVSCAWSERKLAGSLSHSHANTLNWVELFSDGNNTDTVTRLTWSEFGEVSKRDLGEF